MDFITQINLLSDQFYEGVRSIRHYLHQHPELSFEEYHTSEFIAAQLDQMNIPYTKGLGGGTGILATIGEGSPVVALRADIDALPIQEESEAAYVSQNQGIMHACGHDVHTACLLGAARILNDLKNHFKGTVKLIFQPGEERLPGGASLMIADDVLKNPKVEAIFGQHVHPQLPYGKVGYCPGAFMASCDEIFITVIGKGGHGATPHLAIDPILIGSEIIIGLQSIVSRSTPSSIPSVLSIGKINSDGGATNIIPERVMMEGTFRTFDDEWRKEAHQLIRRKVEGIARAHGAKVELAILKGYPSLYNDPSLTAEVVNELKELIGEENLVMLPPRMTAEDFSFYSKEVPACFLRLGTAGDNGDYEASVHTPFFDIEEKALKTGMSVLAYSAISKLTK